LAASIAGADLASERGVGKYREGEFWKLKCQVAWGYKAKKVSREADLSNYSISKC
jgi:hypothetical protein